MKPSWLRMDLRLSDARGGIGAGAVCARGWQQGQMKYVAEQEPKSRRTAALLAALPGLVCCFGLGHLYVGRVRRGLVLLLGGWGLAAVSLFCLTACSMCHLVIPPAGQPIAEAPPEAAAFLVIGVLSFLGLFPLWIWQILDAKLSTK
jgi:hypothetical protein